MLGLLILHAEHKITLTNISLQEIKMLITLTNITEKKNVFF